MEITTSLRLPFLFDEKKLLSDLSLITINWIPHFNNLGYRGTWDAIPLYAPNGDASNIFAIENTNQEVMATPILKDCNYFKEIINSFQCQILSARILKLTPNSEIKPHKDHKLGYEDGNFRIHIPITTNENVHFILDNKRIVMLPGECWYTNVNYTHSVSNTGKTDRIHLVIDGKRNDWSDELFFSLTSKESLLTKPKEELSVATMQLIIGELK